MAITVKTKWLSGMSFDSEINGHHILIDLSKEDGGEDTGPGPKALLLAAIHGCSGMDIVSILKKMRVTGYTFEMDAQAQSTTEHPKTYHTIRVSFLFTGEDLPVDKIVKAVTLSTEQYCGVIAMLSKAARMEFKILINGNEVN